MRKRTGQHREGRGTKPSGTAALLANIALLERELGHLEYLLHQHDAPADWQRRRLQLLERLDEENARLAAARSANEGEQESPRQRDTS